MKQKVLLTPGPITTTKSVKNAMKVDLGTRDSEYQTIVQSVRTMLLELANANQDKYRCILLQGSGTYAVESVLTSTIRKNEKVLILSNGAYGDRMENICLQAEVPYEKISFSMIEALPIDKVEPYIANSNCTHVAYIHCETTAGVLNDIESIQALLHKYKKRSIVDAMSSFASVPIHMDALDIDYLITSANKCLHGVPGLGIVFAKKASLDTCMGISKSLSLDLYDQYRFMEDNQGAFRFTSPTHCLLALQAAILELIEEGGIVQRQHRYQLIQSRIRSCMLKKGFKTLVDKTMQSPVITTFLYPQDFDFSLFYDYFKEHDFLLYNGKLPNYEAFRIGNIGHITDKDITVFETLVEQYKEVKK